MRRSTIRDVAAVAGVSPATVSHALNGTKFVSDEPRTRVLQAAKELNYRPSGVASSLRRQSSGVIGLVLPMQGQDTSSVFFTQLSDGIECAVAGQGYKTIISNTEENTRRQTDQIRLLRGELSDFIDGLIMAATSIEISSAIENLRGIPVVYVDRYPLKFKDEVPFVGTNNYEVTAEALQEFIDRGQVNIVCVSSTIDVSSMIDRYQAFCDTVGTIQGDVKQRVIVTKSTFMHGYDAGKKMLNLFTDIDVVFVTNNTLGMGVLKAIQEAGTPYTNIRMLVYDDYDWMSLMHPAPDAIAQPAFDMGKAAGKMLLEKILHPEMENRSEIIPSEIIFRTR